VSHTLGEIWSQEEARLLGFFEYNGTCDIVCTRVHPRVEGVEQNWRADNQRECSCGEESQPVILYTTYGDGYHWPGRVCWKCEAITSGIRDFERVDGHPYDDVSE
jgi:hypothetical protein